MGDSFSTELESLHQENISLIQVRLSTFYKYRIWYTTYIRPDFVDPNLLVPIRPFRQFQIQIRPQKLCTIFQIENYLEILYQKVHIRGGQS